MYRQHGKLLAAITIALAATFTTAAAQTTVRGVIGSGGTSTSSGAITINATLGQAVTGPSGSSTRALQGFWYTLTPPPPAAVPGEENATAAAMQCAPNPVSAQAELRVRIDHSGPVSLRLFDAIGREVTTLADGIHDAGTISVTLDAAHLAAGSYVAQLVAGNQRQILRIAVVK